jgi:uncharacterized protein
MAISLYDASVPTYLQTLGAMSGFLGKGLAHLREHNIDPEEVVESRLFPDMLPLRFQVQAVAHHSRATLEAFKSGTFRPPSNLSKLDYAGLQALVSETRDSLQKMTPEEVNACDSREVTFQIGDHKLPFKAAEFLLSFSLPNFHFHATTAYDILRSKGVPLGKRDYMGMLRMNA